ncbi:hypothetical protein ACS5NO_25385 [Larkinella sp. GY13]|uniref:hypothetical protein n=1 Tax=Larkinella sp. GY13 TaxID=3453720 RepID=UPI003EEF757A
MKKILYEKIFCALVVLCVFFLTPAMSQSTRQVTVTNVKIEQQETRIKITYDVENLVKSDSVYIQAVNQNNRVLIARSVTGAVGKGVGSGKGKVVYWDIQADGLLAEDEVQVVVNVKLAPPDLGGGPANALLSILVPGLGNVLVQPNKKIGFRPLITVAYGGLLVYGLMQRSKAMDQYAIYESQPYENQAEPYFTKANQLRHQYLIATRAAALILVSDVIYSAIKGSRNRRKFNQLTLGFQGNTPLIGIRRTI